jgi:hypothetical protein
VRGPITAILLLSLLSVMGCATNGSNRSRNSTADWGANMNSNQRDLNQITKEKTGGKIW